MFTKTKLVYVCNQHHTFGQTSITRTLKEEFRVSFSSLYSNKAILLELFPLFDNHGIFVPLALKKSQKDASILAQKSSKEKETCHDQGISSKSKLEFDLCGQWISLFRHMEDMFAQEGSQLVSVNFFVHL